VSLEYMASLNHSIYFCPSAKLSVARLIISLSTAVCRVQHDSAKIFEGAI
jgi:hypothetical protein